MTSKEQEETHKLLFVEISENERELYEREVWVDKYWPRS